jgi:branched-chain amino acid transport system ATP-binding protein
MRPLLEFQSVSKHFGGVQALDAVSFSVEPGQTLGLIGPNGAGKTTVFNVLTGVFKPDAGAIVFGRERTQSLLGKRPDEVAAVGVVRTFQNIRLFISLSAIENVLVGLHGHTRTSLWGAVARTRAARQEEQWAHDRALALLEFVGLAEQAYAPANSLAYGQQRRLELARALAAEPSLLLLDEPAAGLNPAEKQELLALIQRLKQRGLAMILIEHDMRVVMPVSDRVVVLDHGCVIASGEPAAVQRDARVIEAYLGIAA